MRQPPFRAYDGDDAFIFVCYSHADTERVYPELERLRLEGFNIWYDEGVSPGSSWRDDVANAIDDAHVMLLLLTPASATSTHCRKEIHYALDSKPLVIVELEPTELEGGLKLALANIHALRSTELEQEALERKLDEVLQQHTHVRTRIVKDQTIVYTDIIRFVHYQYSQDLTTIERFLLQHEQIVRKTTEMEGGILRFLDGDNCLITFSDTNRALAAIRSLLRDWHEYTNNASIDCPLKIGMSRGTLHIFRSFILGKRHRASGVTPVDITRLLVEEIGRGYFSGNESYVLVTDRVVDNAGEQWNFKPIKADEFFPGNDETSRARRHLAKDMLTIPLFQFLPD